MRVVLAAKAIVQSVRVTNWPTPSPTPVATPDPLALSAVHAAWDTFWVTLLGVIVATAAAIFALKALWVAISDAGRNQKQLAILLRKPKITMGLWPPGRGALGFPLRIAPIGNTNFNKTYGFEVAVQNTGEIQADNYRVSLLVKKSDRLFFQIVSGVQPPMIHGPDELESTAGTVASILLEVHYDGRTIPVTPNPIIICPIQIIAPFDASDPKEITSSVFLRLSCDGGNYFVHEQPITFV
jgi:hypothetical protein